MNRNKSTIGRELKRNLGLRAYSAKQTHSFYVERESFPKRPPRWSDQIEDIVIKKLTNEKWSPEQISNHLKCLSLGVSEPQIEIWAYQTQSLRDNNCLGQHFVSPEALVMRDRVNHCVVVCEDL